VFRGGRSPNQSLLLVNGDWMLSRAKVLAKVVARSGDTDDAHIATAYQRVFGREPSAAEKDAALAYFYDHPAKSGKKGEPSSALVDFCHVLLNGNEFLYVD
jgi:hypothetical protein